MHREPLKNHQLYWGSKITSAVNQAALAEPERNLCRTLCGIYETGEMSAEEYRALWACWYYSTQSGRQVRAMNGPEWYYGLHEDPEYTALWENDDENME